MVMKKSKILIINNDFKTSSRFGRYLAAQGYEILISLEGRNAIDLALRERPDVIIGRNALASNKQDIFSPDQICRTIPVSFVGGYAMAMDYSRAIAELMAEFSDDIAPPGLSSNSSKSNLQAPDHDDNSEIGQA